MLFSDPIRGGVAESLQRAMEAGIKLKVITGDYKETGWAAIRQAGLVGGREVKPDLVMLGEILDKLSGEERNKNFKLDLVCENVAGAEIRNRRNSAGQWGNGGDDG